jgi:hypothetical protein
MEQDFIMRSITLTAKALEIMGVAVIGLAFLYATIRSLLNLMRKKTGTFYHLKAFIGRSLQPPRKG